MIWHRDPCAQFVPLDDGRILVLSRRGMSILVGLALDDVEALLARVNGRRDEVEVAGEYLLEDARAVLQRLAGEVVFEQPVVRRPIQAPSHFEVQVQAIVVGSGALAAVLTETLDARQVKDPDQLEIHPDETVICALEMTPYEQVARVQATAWRAGAPALFVDPAPDGIRLQLTTPSLGPCFACAHVARFRRLGPVSWLWSLTSGLALLESSTLFWRELADMLRGVDNFNQVRLIQDQVRRLPIAPVEECHVCQDTPPLRVPQPTLAAESAWRNASRPITAAMSRPPRLKIGVIGGGTAGYLTALALARKHPQVDLTLIEDKNLPIIGVGEATTPLMPQFLHVDLGLDVVDFFKEVQPTFKLGIHFEWGAGPGFGYPFGELAPGDALRYEGHLGNQSLTAMMMTACRAPVRQDGAMHLDTNVAYHLDNRRFVAYLQRRAEARRIPVIDAHIQEIVREGDEIHELIARDGRRFQFDLYIDCTGFRGRLIEASPFQSYASTLFVDRAVVADVPHDGVVQPHTTAETMDHGWCWRTPQRDADHRGYVFQTGRCSDDQAAAEMRAANPGMGEPRVIAFQTGRRREFRLGNVVAMGNAYGFVEPLESTALHMLIRQIGYLSKSLKAEAQTIKLLNQKVGATWDYLCWFLGLHYKFNQRRNTEFWQACREDVDISRHQELITWFQESGPLTEHPLTETLFDYPDPLWGADGIDVILLGQGLRQDLFGSGHAPTTWRRAVQAHQVALAQSMVHIEALDLLEARSEILAAWIERFREAGPAFG